MRIKAVFNTASDRQTARIQWPDAQFFMSDLEDDEPIDEGDDLVVFVYPDPALADRVLLLMERLLNYKPHLLFNAGWVNKNVGSLAA